MKTRNKIFGAILCVLAGLAFLTKAQAVIPPPDGGYPGFNTAEGQNALFSLTTGSANTAVGWFSLFSNTESSFNTATGAGSLLFNIADQNTAFGAAALLFNTIGENNTAIGAAALLNNTDGSGNTAIGLDALFRNTTGAGNTALGLFALAGNTEGNFNTALGDSAGSNITSANNVICIGINGQNVSDSCFIGNIFGATSSEGTAVFINSSGKLGTTTSSHRLKEQVKPMNQASEALLALKPVSFRYKKEVDPAQLPQFGLVAEDVEKVNRDLVVRDKEGKPYSVRYEAVNAMLLNEFLKEHHQVQDLKAIVAGQQKQIEALTAGLQKVSAELEASKPAPQVVNNP